MDQGNKVQAQNTINEFLVIIELNYMSHIALYYFLFIADLCNADWY